MVKNLVIVESPAKAKTIEKYLGKDFTVKSSFGHVRDLAKKDQGIDIEHDFAPIYEVSADKVKVVNELKKLSKEAEMVWLASDEDREGEAIAWHLFEALNLKKETTQRIVFNEITKTAILHAIENPKGIDYNLVNAQQARRVLDRLVGFELSPLLWKKVKPSLSAGRVQSVAVRLIVEREEEIKAFESQYSYRVTSVFNIITDKGLHTVNAELPKRFKTKDEADAFLNLCKDSSFSISNIEKKPAKKSPAPPFTTSTLQQEASRKLGFSVAKTMMVAQQLYESGKITYMRTDSLNLSSLAIDLAKDEITSQYGKEYIKVRKFTTKIKGAQEAHEAIRPTNLSQHEASGDSSQNRLYELIWKRTIASQMADAQLEKTNVSIDVSNSPLKFVAKGEVVIFDGFLKVYLESTDEDEREETTGMLPPLKVGMPLDLNEMLAVQRFSLPPYRYSEAALVKRMEELGIGRPSTYAPTISTIQKREYVVKGEDEGVDRKYEIIKLSDNKVSHSTKTEKTGSNKGKLVPTDIGSLVTKFLTQHFGNILEYSFTASVEKEFDEIANGLKVWNEMIREFYSPFHKQIEETMETSDKVRGERLLGLDPVSGNNVYARIGRFGSMVQIGETESDDKPRFAGLRKGQSIETITLDEAMELFKFPKTVGEYETKVVTVAIGRFGPYVRHDSKFVSIPKTDDPSSISLERSIELIEEKRKKDREKIIQVFEENPDVQVLNGRWGPYIAIGKDNIRIPKDTDPLSLTLEDCLKLAKEIGVKTKKKTTKKAPAKKAPAKKTTAKKAAPKAAAKKTTTKK
ncbi:MAG: type I DNA topoisomerase [Bacteroidales bacterium]|nr:type I DNA topoisomerase [Bacteroidales bacterium]